MRPVRLIAALVSAATAGILTLSAAPALAASTTAVVVQARPNPVIAGQPVTLSGSVGPEGAATDCADLIFYSEAFARTDDPTAVPLYATAKPSGPSRPPPGSLAPNRPGSTRSTCTAVGQPSAEPS